MIGWLADLQCSRSLTVLVALLIPALWGRSWVLGLLLVPFLLVQGRESLMVPIWASLSGLCLLLARGGSLQFILLSLSVFVGLAAHGGAWNEQIPMRIQTWEVLLLESLKSPFLGHGFSPLGIPVVLSRAESPLLSSHSDLMALAFQGGWLCVGIVGLILSRVCFPLSSFSRRRGFQCSLVSFSLMASVRNTMDQPGVVLVVSWLIYQLLKGARNADH